MKIGKVLAKCLNEELNAEEFKGSMSMNLVNHILQARYDGKFTVEISDTGNMGVYGSFFHNGL